MRSPDVGAVCVPAAAAPSTPPGITGSTTPRLRVKANFGYSPRSYRHYNLHKALGGGGMEKSTRNAMMAVPLAMILLLVAGTSYRVLPAPVGASETAAVMFLLLAAWTPVSLTGNYNGFFVTGLLFRRIMYFTFLLIGLLFGSGPILIKLKIDPIAWIASHFSGT